jgi:hypothetical protein
LIRDDVRDVERRRWLRRAAACAALAAGGRIARGENAASSPAELSAGARPAPAPSTAESAPALHADLVRTGLFRIWGDGGNSLVRLGSQGLVLVDGQAPGQDKPLMSQVRRLARFGDLPLRLMVLTSASARHAGTCDDAIARHVPVMAQAAARERLVADARAGDRAAAIHPFDDHLDMTVGSIDIGLHAFGPARTSGDAVVMFRGLRVVAAGDLVPSREPLPDFDAGGSLVGWARALKGLLGLDFDLAVPGEGPPVPRQSVVDLSARLDALVAQARALVHVGTAADALAAWMAQGVDGWHFELTPRQAAQLREDLGA